MTTQEVANKLVEYCSTGDWEKAYTELYSNDVVSIEMEGAEGYPYKVEGMEGIAKKGERWSSMLEEFHGIEVSAPLVAGDHFTCTMIMDTTMKGAPRSKSEEIALYRVADGKIVSEQFFYAID